MRLLAVLLVIALCAAGLATPAAWGFDVHRQITARALEALPSEVRSVFVPRQAFIVERSVDPDSWRIVDLQSELGPEGPIHYLNIDALDEPAPYTDVPRQWDAFVARYGRARAERAGRLPWRVEEIYERLVQTLGQVRGGASGSATSDAHYLAAVPAHYVEDAFVPFHAVENYDGQLTGQHGIHARFETQLVARNRSRLRLSPAQIQPVDSPRAFIFDTLVDSAALAGPVLEADRLARRDSADDDGYYRAFFGRTQELLERRLSEAANATASLIVSAWQDAAPAAGR